MNPAVWAVYGCLGFVLLAYLAVLIIRPADQSWTWLDGWTVVAVEFIASGLCFARGFWGKSSSSSRLLSVVLGAGLLAWTAGDFALTAETLGGGNPPIPSIADVFYLAFYPLAYAGVLLFGRSELKRLGTSSWLDGAIAGLGAAATCSAFAFQSILHSTGEGIAGTITNLAYPIGDVLLLGLIVASFAALSNRRRKAWALLATGIAFNVVGDTTNLFQNSFAVTHLGVILNSIAWPTAIVVISMAVWLRQRPTNLLERSPSSSFMLPNLAAACALGILFAASWYPVTKVAIVLATATLVTVAIRLAVTVREIKLLSEQRHRQSLTDDLTGLHNRRYLTRVLEAFFAERDDEPNDRTLAFLFVDLNHFKEVNDSFGHPAGDEMLRQLSERLARSLREGDLLVRLGGDEFAIVLIDGTLDQARAVAERITTSLEGTISLGVVNAHIGASIGIAVAPSDSTDATGLVWCADVAMYRAKLANMPFAAYEESLDLEDDRLRLVAELRIAIDQSQLVLHYQPQLDLRTGKIGAVEALLRWVHPRLGLLPPVKFLHIAEDAGFMPALTEWVLETAATQCASWRNAGRPLSVAVNVPPSILLEPRFVDMVCASLQDHGLPAESLVLEITETSVISDRGRDVIEELRTLGLVVSIDDFGAGATSLAYLSNLAVRELKLDRTFLSGIETGDGRRNLDLVRSTIELGHAMGFRIVAEGIEDHATLQVLADMGCDFAQGYCISKPKPAKDLAFRFDFFGEGTAADPKADSAAA